MLEVESDASNMGIRAVMNQGGKSIAFFNEKNDKRSRYSNYGKEVYAIHRDLFHWSQYFLEAMKFVNH